MAAKSKQPYSFGMILYPGFQLTDVSGPVDILNTLSTHVPLSLTLVAEAETPIPTVPDPWPANMDMPSFKACQTLTATKSFANAPQFDVLIVPGGMGCFDPDNKGQPNGKILNPIVDFIKAQYPGLMYLITVCTGSGITSLTGLLDGKRATTFKGAFSVLPKWRPQVQWVPHARWVVDGNIWTSSGVSSGMDVTFGFVKEVYGEDTAFAIAKWMEYVRHEDPDVDPFGIEG